MASCRKGTPLKDDESRVEKLLREGMPHSWIAEDYDVSPQTVRNFARRRGLLYKDGREMTRVWASIRSNMEQREIHQAICPRPKVKA